MQYAVGPDGQARQPQPWSVGYVCPACAMPVIPKCGIILNWHWSHSALTNCAGSGAAEEIFWRRDWQRYAPRDRVEVAHSSGVSVERADVRGPDGAVWEFVYAALEPAEIARRRSLWGNLRWVVHAHDRGFKLEYSTIRNSYSAHRSQAWPTLPLFLDRAALYLDFGDKLLHVEHINGKGSWVAGSLETRAAVARWLRISAGGLAPIVDYAAAYRWAAPLPTGFECIVCELALDSIWAEDKTHPACDIDA